MHREQRVPSTDVLPDVHLVQVDLRAAQSLVVLKAHATLPHHDDNIPPKDIGALREKDAERERESDEKRKAAEFICMQIALTLHCAA